MSDWEYLPDGSTHYKWRPVVGNYVNVRELIVALTRYRDGGKHRLHIHGDEGYKTARAMHVEWTHATIESDFDTEIARLSAGYEYRERDDEYTADPLVIDAKDGVVLIVLAANLSTGDYYATAPEPFIAYELHPREGQATGGPGSGGVDK